MKYNDGRMYIGFFKNGKMHGQGVMKSKDGKIHSEGNWIEGELKLQDPVELTKVSEEKTELCGPDSKFYCG